MSPMRHALTILCTALCLSAPALSDELQAKSAFFTASDNVRIHYLEAGSGPAVVLVPGWTMAAAIWEPQIAHLARNHRVIAVDPRSQGESDKAAEGNYPERRAQDYKELVDKLKLAPAVLVGWSMAVPELLSYVEQYGTASVRAIVLVDGFFGGDPQMATGFARVLKVMQINRVGFTDQFVRSMYRKPQSEEYIKKVVAASLKTPTNSAVTLGANMFAGDWRPALAKLDKPVLYVIATPRLKADGEALKARAPSARVEFFETAGHALFVDEAERFNKLLDDFLAGAK